MTSNQTAKITASCLFDRVRHLRGRGQSAQLAGELLRAGPMFRREHDRLASFSEMGGGSLADLRLR
jgi:hypothetical protein